MVDYFLLFSLSVVDQSSQACPVKKWVYKNRDTSQKSVYGLTKAFMCSGGFRIFLRGVGAPTAKVFVLT